MSQNDFAQNQRHDVAVVQAALGKARAPNRKPFWPGPIDGDYSRHHRALDQSIAVFQQCHRLRPSGKINRLGSDVDRLENALPAGHRRRADSADGGRGNRVVAKSMGQPHRWTITERLTRRRIFWRPKGLWAACRVGYPVNTETDSK